MNLSVDVAFEVLFLLSQSRQFSMISNKTYVH